MTRLLLAAAVLLLALTGCATATNEDAPQADPQRIVSPADDPNATVAQTQALEAAEAYVTTSYMSAEGLRKQLAFDKHPGAAITYAMDHVEADWDTEAEEAAGVYMDSGLGLSREGLRDQLRFDGFTKAQTDRAIERTWGKH